jgi:ParB-like chromosome segregation protein Spo0J
MRSRKERGMKTETKSGANKNDGDAERRLLSSIMERDIVEPLQVSVDSQSQTYVLLDGFKRYRCAKKLDKGTIPVECIAEDESGGVALLLRRRAAGAV